jgi:hypothetical protein
MKYINVLIIVLLPNILIGCGIQMKVTYQTNPPGAMIYESGVFKGYSPVTLIYNFPLKDRENPYVILRGTEAKWASGASAKIDNLKAYWSNGVTQGFIFNRPEGVDGLTEDIKFSLEVQKMTIMQQQAQAQRDANFLMFNSMMQNSQPKRIKTNCSSNVIGNTIFTDCN